MWSPVTLDHVRAVVSIARVDRSADADGDGQLEVYFRLYHMSVVADIRSRLAQAHQLDSDPATVPPEFVLLAAMRIAAVFLGRPGPMATDGTSPYSLTPEQSAEIKRLETRLDAAANGGAITAPALVETEASTTGGSPGPSISEPTRYWGRDSQDGIGAY